MSVFKTDVVATRLDPQLHEKLKARAEQEDRTLSAQIRHAVRLHLADSNASPRTATS